MLNEISKNLVRTVSSVVSGSKLLEGKKEEYQKFFNAALKKFGAKSPSSLDAKKKKEFFNYIEKNWTRENESVEEAKLREAILEAVKRYTFSIDDTIAEDDEDDEDGKDEKKDDSKPDLSSVISKMVQDEIKKANAPEGKEIKLSGKKDKIKV